MYCGASPAVVQAHSTVSHRESEEFVRPDVADFQIFQKSLYFHKMIRNDQGTCRRRVVCMGMAAKRCGKCVPAVYLHGRTLRSLQLATGFN